MKVRLKLCIGSPNAIISLMFQFHEGPIKTLLKATCNTFVIGFNSMKVRLKHENSSECWQYGFGFNSMKVRLKRGACFFLTLKTLY